MSLSATLGLTLGTLNLELSVTVAGGEVVAILGPNGSGKTTLLRALAGLIELTSGHVELNGTVLDDPGRAIHVPAGHRNVGYVFQDYLLFPHLSVLDNIAFGLRARGAGRLNSRREAGQWLDRVGLQSYAHARPAELSGGQAQRVALARALAPGPRMLLLDEPLAALDAATKLQVRRELIRHLESFEGTTLVVTHDPLEAAALAGRLMVMEGGRVVQQGSFAEVASRPRSPYVAELVGLNLVRGRGAGDTVELSGAGRLQVASPVQGQVFAAVHPRAVSLHRTRPDGSARNVWEGTISSMDLEGDRVRISVEGQVPLVAEVTARSVAEMKLAQTSRIWVSVKATEIQVYPV